MVALPAAVAIALCVYELTTRSLWLDEAATVAIAGQHGSAFWNAIAHDGGNMLGYYALLHVLIGWFGDGAFVIRLPSVLAAGAAAGAVSLLGLRLFDRRVALAAGLLTAVSLPLVFWGQDASGYAAMVALVAGSFVAFAALVQIGPAPRVDRLRRPHHAVGVRELRRDLRTARAAGRARVAPAGLAPRAERDGGVRGLLDPAGGAGGRAAARASCSGYRARTSSPSGRSIQALTSAGFEPNFRPVAVATPLAILTVALLLFAAARVVRRPRWGPLLALSWLVGAGGPDVALVARRAADLHPAQRAGVAAGGGAAARVAARTAAASGGPRWWS